MTSQDPNRWSPNRVDHNEACGNHTGEGKREQGIDELFKFGGE